ncbi:hypothetical protein ABIB05_007748, partial [Bradyrhizobium sp. LB5.2]
LEITSNSTAPFQNDRRKNENSPFQGFSADC